MSVMAPDTIPAPKVQLTPLPDQASAVTLSSPSSQAVAKVTLQSIMKRVSKKNDSAQKQSNIHPPNQLRGELYNSRTV